MYDHDMIKIFQNVDDNAQVRPDAGPVPRPIPLNPEKLVLPQPGEFLVQPG